MRRVVGDGVKFAGIFEVEMSVVPVGDPDPDIRSSPLAESLLVVLHLLQGLQPHDVLLAFFL